jgi:hypothetical protein
VDDPFDMNDTPQDTSQEQTDNAPTEPIVPPSEPPNEPIVGRGQQPVTRNQAAIAAAIVVVGIGGFALGKASNDDRPVAFHGGQQLRGDGVGGPGGGQQGGPGRFGGPGGERQDGSPGGRGGPWDQRDDLNRGGEDELQEKDDGQ